ncbi:hypothetical protein [Falsiroseomonas tokyonensis]|uniref:DUF4398 domain-containing protein n=1 Tax=Falsiroseomonas tokyonensis TaxID=430521 RepID=A0ABV7BS51_9PROT|nr:hypothetical protein [Falsiroseomonas tokyonensis]MBU8536878.1 hypothetical protein [Falsiroseomonas tokyonensis]
MRSNHALILASALILPWAAQAQVTQPMNSAPMSSAPMTSSPMASGTETQPMASAMDTVAVENFLQSARQALSANRMAQARENLEQAETRLLTRSTLPSQAGTPMARGPVADISAARDALDRRDRAAVNRHIDQAMAHLRQPASMGSANPAGDMSTGSSMPSAPASGGGAMGAPRSLGPTPAPMFQPGPMPNPSTR